MGTILSRKKQSTTEVLELLEKEIEGLESYRRETEQRQRRLIASFLFYSFFFYFVACLAGYFYYSPATPSEWTMLALPVVALPSLFWLAKVALGAWYHRLLRSNDDKLLEAQERRRKILDEVKETETYKVAQELLERFDPSVKQEKAAKEAAVEERKVAEALRRRTITPEAATGLRQRKPPEPTPPNAGPIRPPATNGLTPRPGVPVIATPAGPRPLHSTPFGPGAPPFAPGLTTPLRLPKPLLPRERSNVDKFVDYLLGDGPNHRFALICSQCRSHNGMCLAEEFAYCAFRCCYCGFFNPARTQRPQAPRLPTPVVKSKPSEETEPHTEEETPSETNTASTDQEPLKRDSSKDSSPENLPQGDTLPQD